MPDIQKQTIVFEGPVLEREFNFGDREHGPESEREATLGMWVLGATLDPPIDIGQLAAIEEELWPQSGGSLSTLRAFSVNHTSANPNLEEFPAQVSKISIAYLQLVDAGGHDYPSTHEEVIDHLQTNIAPAVAGAIGAAVQWAKA